MEAQDSTIYQFFSASCTHRESFIPAILVTGQASACQNIAGNLLRGAASIPINIPGEQPGKSFSSTECTYGTASLEMCVGSTDDSRAHAFASLRHPMCCMPPSDLFNIHKLLS
jgi:hypothetical protein